MTTDTFLSYNARLALTAWLSVSVTDRAKGDSLVTTIHTGDIAPPATDTFGAVNLREDHGVAVEVRRQDDVLQFFAYEFL